MKTTSIDFKDFPFGFEIERSKFIEYAVNERNCYLVTKPCPNIRSGGHVSIVWKGKLKKLHRIVYSFIYGDIPEGQVIRHSCDNANCININHLELGSQADNVHDCISRGRAYIPIGSANPKSKLTEDQVRCIRTISYIYPQSELRKMFGISKAMMSKIIAKTHWTHIE